MAQDNFGKCPYATAQAALQGKWTMLIMHLLEDGPLRFNELLRRLPQMTHATLSKQLKRMETDGLVIRTEYPQVPPKVEYSLSPVGGKFRSVLDVVGAHPEWLGAPFVEEAEWLRDWGFDYIDYLKETGTIDADGNRVAAR